MNYKIGHTVLVKGKWILPIIGFNNGAYILLVENSSILKEEGYFLVHKSHYQNFNIDKKYLGQKAICLVANYFRFNKTKCNICYTI